MVNFSLGDAKLHGFYNQLGWMDERVLGHFFALSRLNWAGDNLD